MFQMRFFLSFGRHWQERDTNSLIHTRHLDGFYLPSVAFYCVQFLRENASVRGNDDILPCVHLRALFLSRTKTGKRSRHGFRNGSLGRRLAASTGNISQISIMWASESERDPHVLVSYVPHHRSQKWLVCGGQAGNFPRFVLSSYLVRSGCFQVSE